MNTKTAMTTTNDLTETLELQVLAESELDEVVGGFGVIITPVQGTIIGGGWYSNGTQCVMR